ncbi:MAG TPA: pyrroline-5-carboxylate reductase dimerization domain-containing protein, partial [Legionellaceae bacterium]|nr:pyrroline-5-carboxylate reductase dimerization domain-containing protein [Legionellaceae bacterium]
LVVSLAAKTTIKQIEQYLDLPNPAIVRIMTTLTVSVGKGVLGYYQNDAVTSEQKQSIMRILKAMSTVKELKKEEDINAFTAAFGCWPGILAKLLQPHQAIATSMLDLTAKEYEQMMIQVLSGVSELLEAQSSVNTENNICQQLFNQVASKGGGTEAAGKHLEENGYSDLLEKAFKIAYARFLPPSHNPNTMSTPSSLNMFSPHASVLQQTCNQSSRSNHKP